MNGLLQRLSNQALGTQGQAAAPRIRPAMSVHAHVPLALAAGNEGSWPDLQPFVPPAEVARESPATTAAEPAVSRVAPLVAQSSVELRQPTNQAQPAPSRSATHAAAVVSVGAAAHVARAREPSIPPRLLDEVKPATPSPTAIAPIPPAMQCPSSTSYSTASAETTEVHVHIGRIEVTAVHDAAPAKKSQAPARQTRPLADYLARRSRA